MRFSFSFEVSRNPKPAKRPLEYAEADYKIPDYLQSKPTKSTTKRKPASVSSVGKNLLAKKQLEYKVAASKIRAKRVVKPKTTK